MEALLPRDLLAMSSIVAVGGRSNISSVARTLLVNHREPLALVADADSLEAGVIRDKYTTLIHLLKEVAAGTPFKVILCTPVIEAIFFEAVDILERVFPKVDLS